MRKGDFVACTAPAGVAVALDVKGELARALTVPERLSWLQQTFGSAADAAPQDVSVAVHSHSTRRHTLVFEFAALTHAAAAAEAARLRLRFEQ